MNRLRLTLQRLSVIAFIVFMWELTTGGIDPRFMLFSPLLAGRPSLIIIDLYGYLISGLFLKDFIFTMQATFIGLFIGIVTGVGCGLLFAYHKGIAETLDPIFVGFNSLPRPALAPLLLIWFGLGIASKIFLAWSIVFFLVFYNTLLGVKSIDPDLIKVVKVMGASKLQIMKEVTLPAVFSWIFAAFRVSVSFALIGAIIGEFVGSHAGLGYRMAYSAGLFLTQRVYGILIILMFIGATLVEISKRIENAVLKWRPQIVF
ncbi:MAG: ABC transporter permease [Nitrososphaerales archaeon]|nr:ABC transporter permease [Nitrososphaerales archaeon]